MTKIQPIPEQLWKALCVISNEINDIMEHATKNDFGNDADFMVLKDSQELLTEFIL